MATIGLSLSGVYIIVKAVLLNIMVSPAVSLPHVDTHSRYTVDPSGDVHMRAGVDPRFKHLIISVLLGASMIALVSKFIIALSTSIFGLLYPAMLAASKLIAIYNYLLLVYFKSSAVVDDHVGGCNVVGGLIHSGEPVVGRGLVTHIKVPRLSGELHHKPHFRALYE